MVHFVDGNSELYLDDALAPILIVTWIGPATLVLVEKLARWTDEQNAIAKRLGRPVITVHDALAADRPSADVRRAFAEQKGDPTVATRTYVVLTNPLVRGAMTAIGWMAGDKFDVVACKTMAEAFAQATEYARAHGLARRPRARWPGMRPGRRRAAPDFAARIVAARIAINSARCPRSRSRDPRSWVGATGSMLASAPGIS